MGISVLYFNRENQKGTLLFNVLIPALAFQVLALQVCATMPGSHLFICYQDKNSNSQLHFA